MERLNLPPFDIRIERKGDKIYVWDVLRRSYVRLTPEEWVRQHFVHYLISHCAYPPQLMMNEASLNLGDKRYRADTILYRRNLEPHMIVEYKAPSVELSERVLEQIVRYNYTLGAPYLILSNGLTHMVYELDLSTQSYRTLEVIPHYSELSL